jgi:hypothetical protein
MAYIPDLSPEAKLVCAPGMLSTFPLSQVATKHEHDLLPLQRRAGSEGVSRLFVVVACRGQRGHLGAPHKIT